MFYNVLKAFRNQGLGSIGCTIAEAEGLKRWLSMFNIYQSLDFGLTLTSTFNGEPDDNPMAEVGLTIPHDGRWDVKIADGISITQNGNSLARYGLLKPFVPRWQRIAFRSLYSGIILTTLVPDPISKTNLIFEISLSLPRMSQVLNQLAEGTMEETGATIYIYGVDASSPFYEDAVNSGLAAEFPELEFLQIDTLFAVSNGTSYVAGDTIEAEGRLLKDIEATDPGIRGIAISIHKSYSYKYLNEVDDVPFITSVGKQFIVQVTSLQLKEGLDWWLVLAIDADYLLSDTIQQQEKARLADEEEQKHIDSDLNENKRVIFGVILAVSFALFIVSIAITHFMLKPLLHLKDEMRKVSEMNLETETSPGILFYELSSMQTSFEKMVSNLKEYKAYVPTAVLQGSLVVEVPPPTGVIGLVFTDIVSSTALWARAASEMNDALEIHNNCIRALIREFNGYEVKTIGDAFMVSFSNGPDAVRFCLKTQEAFVKQNWPSELELPPQYDRPGDSLPMWNGLRLRMGCSVGEAGMEENPLTGRAEYRGTIVSIASRLESKALPGTLCVTKEFHQIIKSFLLEDEAAYLDFGSHDLRGIGEVELVIMCTTSLAPRLRTRQYNYETLGAAPTRERGRRATMSRGSAASAHSSDEGGTRALTHTIRNKKTGLSLSNNDLTVAVCRLFDIRNSKVFENYNLLLRLAIDAAVQTDGVLGGVTDRTLTVVWNASKPCRLHTTAALRFTSQIEWRAGAISRVGIATGNLFHGNVGTSTQRFATTVGLPLEAAQAAADAAYSLGTFAVLADCSESCGVLSNTAVAPFLRMADSWMDSESNQIIPIYQVLCSVLMKQLEDGWGIVGGDSASATEAHNKAFKDVLAGEGGQLEKMRLQAADGDQVLANIISLLDEVQSLDGSYRVKVNFTRLPEGFSFACCEQLTVTSI
eukprot:TRINITY_DN3625_c0_g1_i3.p1 TRINITY_DN3625_c0_g1~~TRINITY_DN3625_c0_g1_i3.p1  ORF type:complete len:1090 (+),score=205.05 TRINITY_DN3625_c0_g1_i3:481-3270(+)